MIQLFDFESPSGGSPRKSTVKNGRAIADKPVGVIAADFQWLKFEALNATDTPFLLP